MKKFILNQSLIYEMCLLVITNFKTLQIYPGKNTQNILCFIIH